MIVLASIGWQDDRFTFEWEAIMNLTISNRRIKDPKNLLE